MSIYLKPKRAVFAVNPPPKQFHKILKKRENYRLYPDLKLLSENQTSIFKASENLDPSMDVPSSPIPIMLGIFNTMSLMIINILTVTKYVVIGHK